MGLLGARFGRIVDETAACVPVLSGKGIFNDGHFLDGRVGYRTFLRALVTFGVSKSRAVKPVFRRQRLPAVDARGKLAAAEDGISIRLHGHKPRLKL